MSDSSSQLASMQSFLTASLIALTWMSRMRATSCPGSSWRRTPSRAWPYRRGGRLPCASLGPSDAPRDPRPGRSDRPEHVGDRHDHLGPGPDGLVERLVDVGHVEVAVAGGRADRQGRPAPARLLVADHHDAVADLDLAVHQRLAVGARHPHELLGPERLPVELEHLGAVANGD